MTIVPATYDEVEITAGRLHLRPWRSSDAEEVFAACQDPDIQRWTTIPSPYTEADARWWVGVEAPRLWRDHAGAPFAVVDATTGGLLASVGLNVVTGDGLAEIGYWCRAEVRGKGVMTQAVGVVARWAFDAVGVQRLQWQAEVGNGASRRVAEKAGFVVEGVLRSGLYNKGSRVDSWIGSRLPSDPVRTA